MLWLRGMDIKADLPDEETFSRAKRLLDVARSERRHDLRLSRLYYAFRDLMTMPYRQTRAAARFCNCGMKVSASGVVQLRGLDYTITLHWE